MLALPSISIKVKMPFWWEPQPARSRWRFDGNHNQRGSLLRPESRFQIFFGKPSGPMGFRGSTSWLPLWSELFILPKYIFSKWLKFVLSNGFDNLSGCHTYLVIRFRKNAPITCILPNSIIRRLSKRIMIWFSYHTVFRVVKCCDRKQHSQK